MQIRRLPTEVWVLGCASLLMDTSSELVHSLLPVYLTAVLGAGMVSIGLIEGVAEATAAIAKVFSGALSDWLGRRKRLIVFGYGLAALTKPMFPLAKAVGWVFAARFIDRIGKGIRGAPRDALLADVTPPELRGAAFGLRQALDSVGAVLGPLLALVMMAILADNLRGALWIAVVPAVLTVVVLVFGVREPETHAQSAKPPWSFAAARQLERGYWRVVALGVLFTLARFSEAFLVLRATDLKLAIGHAPLVFIVMNVIYSAAAYPAGIAADRIARRTLLSTGLVVLVAADLCLALASGLALVWVGAALWGLHMALTQGLLSKMVADHAPAELRGTAFGVFNLSIGIALLIASAAAGVLWESFGPMATFLTGAALSALAILFALRDP